MLNASAADAIKALRFMIPLVLVPLRIDARGFQEPEPGRSAIGG
jgi:hypothetical protein